VERMAARPSGDGVGTWGMADPRSVIEQVVESVNRHDTDAWDTLFSPDCRCITATGRTVDVPGLQRVLANTLRAFPDLQVRVERWVIDGDVVVTEELMEGTHKGPFAGLAPTGRRMHIPLVHVSRVVDGRVVERIGYHDTAAIIRQLRAEDEAGERPPPVTTS
jgi:steroid delta-isomerase-like uncharacterized protein